MKLKRLVRGTGTVNSSSREWRKHRGACGQCRRAWKYSDCCAQGQSILALEAAAFKVGVK